jgi:hypothetical protein
VLDCYEELTLDWLGSAFVTVKIPYQSRDLGKEVAQ